MKNRLAYLFLGIFGMVGLASCESQLEDVPSVKTRTVFFSSVEKDAATRTGITIEDKVVTPDWRKTQAANVHLFETGKDGGVSTGEDIEITVASDNLTANFKADFPEEWSIIVDPGEGSDEGTLKAGNTKASSNAPYTYSAIIAQKSGDSFIVPAVQYPDAQTLIDPDADFLIGYSRKSYDDPHDYTENVVDLYFDRPVALSRISVSNFEAGEQVKSVTIKAQSGLTGSAAYNAIDFENAKVTFTPGTQSGAIELSYGSGADIAADGTFQAYFVSLPGTVTITELSVATDKYTYVKTIAGGKEFTFSEKSFKTIKLDLSTATKEEATPDNTIWYKASVLEDGINYLVVSGGQALKNNNGSTAGVAVTDNAGIIAFEAEVDPALVWTATAHQETTGDNGSGGVVAGHFTLTNNGYYLLRDSQEITLGDAIPSAKPKYAVWDYDGTYLKHESSETMTFYCYYDGGWATGYTQNGAAPASSIKTVQIYTSRTPQAMTFSESTVNYDVDAGGDFVEPTLDGAKTEVRYSSSNEAVATVDPSTGAVTIKKAGTTTITATAEGNAEYQAGTASYEIVATSGSIDTFYLASEIVPGESYMIVSNGKAMTTDGSTLNAVNVTGAGEATILISAAEVSLFEAAAHIEYYEGTSPAGHYTLSCGGNYLQRLSNSGTQTGTIGAIPSNKKYYVWEYDGEHLYHLSSASNTFYLGYDSGWVFAYSGTLPNTYLYSTSKPLTPQHLAFSSESVSAVLGQPFTAPTLTGAKTEVSYASSDASVATVDSDGAVTLNGVGITTITASAVASEEYNAGSASYILKVTDGSVTTKRYVLTNTIQNGKNYIIVSGGFALENNGGSVSSVGVTPVGNAIEFAVGEDESLVWSAKTETGYTDNGHFSLSNDGYRLNRKSSSGSFSLTFVTTSTAMDKYGVWDLQVSGGNTYLFHDSSNTMRCWLYYDGGWKISYRSNNTEPSSTEKPTQLYVEDDGGSGSGGDEPGGGDDPTPTGTTYYPASSIVAGQQYLIVSNGKALQNGGGSAAALDVTVSSGNITLDAPTSVLWTAQVDGDGFCFINDSQYLRRPSSGSTAGVGSKSSTADNNQWYYDADNQYFTVKHTSSSSGNTTTYYLRYNSSWEISTTIGNVTLYTANPG